jgi:hypothetical protein
MDYQFFLGDDDMSRLFAQPHLVRPTLGYCADGGILKLEEAGTSVEVFPDIGNDPPVVVVEGMPSYRCEVCGEVCFDLVLLSAAERQVKARIEQGLEVPLVVRFHELGVITAQEDPA